MAKTTIYLLSHSHTDIGFTDRQKRIARYHADYIHQLLDVMTDIEAGKHSEWNGYKWTCENYWQVENFYKHNSMEYQQKFEHFVRKGWIDVSLNYLNLNDLIDDSVLRKKLSDAKKWSQKVGFYGQSSMTADINGLGWGYADALYDNGINNLYMCIHTHHGMYPLFKKQTPFYWQSPKGHRLLVWSGDHYMIGNEFQLVPGNRYSYLRNDEYFGDETTDQYTITKKRIFDYIDELKNNGLKYDFFPVSLSGVRTDNSPSNPRMVETVDRWNKEFGEQVELKISTLDEFFNRLSKERDIPTYSGDWPDWWAEGPCSTPDSVKIYKEAQRSYNISTKLDPDDKLGVSGLKAKATDNMMLYAEHTWGYSASVSNPADSMVNVLDYRNAAYASVANEEAMDNLDEILSHYGSVSPKPYRQKLFGILNPHDTEVSTIASVSLMSWESVDGHPLNVRTMNSLVIEDAKTGTLIPAQVERSLRGFEIRFVAHLKPKEEQIVKVLFDQNMKKQNYSGLTHGAEGVNDILLDNTEELTSIYHLRNQNFDIRFDSVRGINSLVFLPQGKNLIRKDSKSGAFSGIYEISTDNDANPPFSRKMLGRNRKAQNVQRFVSKVLGIKVINNGPIYTDVQITSELTGTQEYEQTFRVYKTIPKIDVNIQIEKNIQANPENVYISLPFSLGEDTVLTIDKTGCVMRPGIDQLPGTNLQHYLTQHGARLSNGNAWLDIVLEDAPLLWLGTLDAHLIDLNVQRELNTAPLYSWVMNNYWETNFKADLSGFYEFKYHLTFGNGTDDSDIASALETESEGLLSFRYSSNDFGGDLY